MPHMKNVFTKGTIMILLFGFINQPLFTPNVYAQNTDVMQFVKEYGLDAIAKIFLQRFLDKIVQSTLVWANGGFDGEPSFISNWDEFIKDVKTDAIRSGLDYALYVANVKLGDLAQDVKNKKAICQAEVYEKLRKKYSATTNPPDGGQTTLQGDVPADELAREIKKQCGSDFTQGTANTLAQAAHDNWMHYHTGGGLDARYAALTLAKYGARELNVDSLKQEIDKEQPLGKLLGRGGVEEYKNDFSRGGWLAYIQQSGDNPIVNQSRLIEKMREKSSKKVKSTLDQVFASNKYLDKKECPKGKDEYGKCKGEDDLKTKGTKNENYSKITTDKGAIAAKVKKELLRPEEESIAADEFTEIIANAVGTLAFGLLETGAKKLLTDAMSRKGKNGNVFYRKLDTFITNQDDYDVLGIEADANLSNDTQNSKGGHSSRYSGSSGNDIYNVFAGNDDSIRYIAGPEDVEGKNYSLENSPEVIIDLHKSLDRELKLTKAYLDELIKTRVILNRSASYASTLDHCLPGPDLGWEERYKDKVRWVRSEKFDYPDNESNQEMCDRIHRAADQWEGEGFTLTKEMSQDSLLNIPGAPQLRSMVNSLTGDTLRDKFSGIGSDISDKRRVYVALLMTKENILERMRKIQDNLGISVDLPLFEDQVLKIEMKKELRDKLSSLENVNSFQDVVFQANTQNASGNSSTHHNSVNAIGVSVGNNTTGNSGNGNIPRQQNGETLLDSPTSWEGVIKVKDNLDSLSSLIPQKLKEKPEEIIQLPSAFGIYPVDTEWKISDRDLLSILKLPASLVDKNAKQGELLVENLGLYLFKKGKSIPFKNDLSDNSVDPFLKKEQVAQESPELLVKNDKRKAVKIAMDLAWTLWRKYAPREEKARARYQYHILNSRGKLTTDRAYLEAQLNSRNLSELSKKAIDYAADCQTFVSLFGGSSLSGIASAVGSNISPSRTDQEISQLLEEEYNKQQRGEKSVFMSDLFTSPAHRKVSILKFGSKSELEKYYKDMYPGARENKRAFSILELLEKDKTKRTLSREIPKMIVADKGMIEWSFAVPAVAVVQFFNGRRPFRVAPNPNEGKVLFCNAIGPEYEDACWKGHRVDLCVTTGSTRGQTWYYSPRSVYRAAIADIMSSSF